MILETENPLHLPLSTHSHEKKGIRAYKKIASVPQKVQIPSRFASRIILKASPIALHLGTSSLKNLSEEISKLLSSKEEK